MRPPQLLDPTKLWYEDRFDYLGQLPPDPMGRLLVQFMSMQAASNGKWVAN